MHCLDQVIITKYSVTFCMAEYHVISCESCVLGMIQQVLYKAYS